MDGAFSDSYQKKQCREEVFVRFFELLASSQGALLSRLYPELYGYMKDCLIPYINLHLYALNADASIDNSSLGMPTIADTLGTYDQAILANMAKFVVRNEPKRGPGLLDILYKHGMDFTPLKGDDGPYAEIIARYQPLTASF
jgi:hypothetical protein